jgi:hypothetical protein
LAGVEYNPPPQFNVYRHGPKLNWLPPEQKRSMKWLSCGFIAAYLVTQPIEMGNLW